MRPEMSAGGTPVPGGLSAGSPQERVVLPGWGRTGGLAGTCLHLQFNKLPGTGETAGVSWVPSEQFLRLASFPPSRNPDSPRYIFVVVPQYSYTSSSMHPKLQPLKGSTSYFFLPRFGFSLIRNSGASSSSHTLPGTSLVPQSELDFPLLGGPEGSSHLLFSCPYFLPSPVPVPQCHCPRLWE